MELPFFQLTYSYFCMLLVNVSITFFTSTPKFLRALLQPLHRIENSQSNLVPCWECYWISGSLSHMCSSKVKMVFSSKARGSPASSKLSLLAIGIFESMISQFSLWFSFDVDLQLLRAFCEDRGVDGLVFCCYIWAGSPKLISSDEFYGSPRSRDDIVRFNFAVGWFSI